MFKKLFYLTIILSSMLFSTAAGMLTDGNKLMGALATLLGLGIFRVAERRSPMTRRMKIAVGALSVLCALFGFVAPQFASHEFVEKFTRWGLTLGLAPVTLWMSFELEFSSQGIRSPMFEEEE